MVGAPGQGARISSPGGNAKGARQNSEGEISIEMTKSEGRNPKDIRMTKPEFQMVLGMCFVVRHTGFGFLSSFGIRNLYVSLQLRGLFPLTPALGPNSSGLGRERAFGSAFCYHRPMTTESFRNRLPLLGE